MRGIDLSKMGALLSGYSGVWQNPGQGSWNSVEIRASTLCLSSSLLPSSSSFPFYIYRLAFSAFPVPREENKTTKGFCVYMALSLFLLLKPHGRDSVWPAEPIGYGGGGKGWKSVCPRFPSVVLEREVVRCISLMGIHPLKSWCHWMWPGQGWISKGERWWTVRLLVWVSESM